MRTVIGLAVALSLTIAGGVQASELDTAKEELSWKMRIEQSWRSMFNPNPIGEWTPRELDRAMPGYGYKRPIPSPPVHWKLYRTA